MITDIKLIHFMDDFRLGKEDESSVYLLYNKNRGQHAKYEENSVTQNEYVRRYLFLLNLFNATYTLFFALYRNKIE